MTTPSHREKCIEILKKHYPGIYASLMEYVPNLIVNPNHASKDDIAVFNEILILHIGKIASMKF